jgi:hypothetical protein
MPNPSVRSIAATALACVAGLLLPTTPGCGTDAIGVEDCRKIEQARCDLGAACGRVEDVDSCRRFYRDHCLHGLALENSPGTAQVKACADAISAAASCAKLGGPQASASACPGIGPTALPLACDVISRPEATEVCRFLVPSTPPVTIDAPVGPVDSGGPDSGAD